MSFLKRLPAAGRGSSRERAFGVTFKGGKAGLERLVDLATSQEGKKIILADVNLSEPVATLLVYLTQGANSILKAYHVRAELTPFPGHTLKVRSGDFAGFKVEKIGGRIYSLSSHLLTRPNTVDVFTNNFGGEIRLHSLLTYGTGKRLIEKEVQSSLRVFADALEDAVNAAYRHAGKQPSKKTVVLEPLYLL